MFGNGTAVLFFDCSFFCRIFAKNDPVFIKLEKLNDEDGNAMLDLDAIKTFRYRALNPSNLFSSRIRSEPGRLLPDS